MRINRYLARSGVTSRRKAEVLVSAGKVFVNGEKVTELSTEISENDIVTIDGRQIKVTPPVYFAFNKPVGVTVTARDRHAERTIFDFLPNDMSLFAVGRLDRDTSGLLLITSDGDFAQNIIHPSKKIEKEYLVGLAKNINESDFKKLLSGVQLEDGSAKAKSIKRITGNNIRIVIEMGRKRIVRRMFEAIGNKVTSLERTRIGTIKLDVPLGEYRELKDSETQEYV